MKKNTKQKNKDYDVKFDDGEVAIDFSKAKATDGLSKLVKLPPITIPGWLAVEIENLAKLQANPRASVVRQLLVEAISKRKESA